VLNVTDAARRAVASKITRRSQPEMIKKAIILVIIDQQHRRGPDTGIGRESFDDLRDEAGASSR